MTLFMNDFSSLKNMVNEMKDEIVNSVAAIHTNMVSIKNMVSVMDDALMALSGKVITLQITVTDLKTELKKQYEYMEGRKHGGAWFKLYFGHYKTSKKEQFRNNCKPSLLPGLHWFSTPDLGNLLLYRGWLNIHYGIMFLVQLYLITFLCFFGLVFMVFIFVKEQ